MHLSSMTIHSENNPSIEGCTVDIAPRAVRKNHACVHCKSLKVRCQFNPGDTKCQRCRSGSHPCEPRERKPRKPTPTHEELQEQARERDLRIQWILLQWDVMKASERIRRWTGHSPLDDCRMFGGFDLLYHPEIVKYCSLLSDDIMNLFKIFFERMNAYFSILDPELHTPEKLIYDSPFLFTVICAVASRYYTQRPGLYHVAMEFARDAAGKALVDGSASVAVCQAYLIMAVYPVPKKKWVQDRSWLLMGVAIRMALELGLNKPPPAYCDEREKLNRMRTWLNCYCVDGSHAIQFGKIPMLPLDDYLAQQSKHWYRSSPMNLPYDVHLTAYVPIILIVAEWRSLTAVDPEGAPPRNLDVIALALETQEKIRVEFSWWRQAYDDELIRYPLPICAYRGNTTHLISLYLRLVILASGFEQAVREAESRCPSVISKAVEVARDVIKVMVEQLSPTGYLRFALEANFLYVSFAAAFLINLLRPEFLPLLDGCIPDQITQDVEGLIAVLGSENVALDGRHTPALYSRFLSSLLAKHRDNCQSTCFDSRPQSDSDFNIPSAEGQEFEAPDTWYWPSVAPAGSFMTTPQESDISFQIQSDCSGTHQMPEMDLSPKHFLTTVNQGFRLQPPPAETDFATWFMQ